MKHIKIANILQKKSFESSAKLIVIDFFMYIALFIFFVFEGFRYKDMFWFPLSFCGYCLLSSTLEKKEKICSY